MTKQRKKFLTLVKVWMCLMLLLTPWRGVTYNQVGSIGSSAKWQYGGTFDLALRIPRFILDMPPGIPEFFSLPLPLSPIFLPPRSYGGFETAVRYPLMPRNHHEIVEFDWMGIAIELWLGAVLLGFIGGQSKRAILKERVQPDLLLCIARSAAWTLIFVAPCWLILSFAIFGMFSDETKIGIFTLTITEFTYFMLGLGLATATALGYLKFRRVSSAVKDKTT